MEKEKMILADEFCIHHNVELSFIYSLQESGLVEILQEQEKTFVPASQLCYLEKLARLHYEMDINLEGIETISYLLNKMDSMQQQLTQLANRLKRYEDD